MLPPQSSKKTMGITKANSTGPVRTSRTPISIMVQRPRNCVQESASTGCRIWMNAGE